MNVQAAPPPYVPGQAPRAPSGNPPVLGQQVPGMSGGLPAQGGLSVMANPMAEQLHSYGYGEAPPSANPAAPNQQQSAYPYPYPPTPNMQNSNPMPMASYADGGVVHKAEEVRQKGRGDDSILMHVTPHELGGLQALAMAHGGSLTINPETGLPEAGWLGKLLPTILGAALAATGVGAPLAAGMVGLGQTALTGSLSKGLMAGLSAFGGASFAGAAGIGGKLAGGNAFGLLGDKAGILGANMGAGAGTGLAGGLTTAGGTPVASAAGQAGGNTLNVAGGTLANATPTAANIAAGAPSLASQVSPVAAATTKTGLAGLAQRFGDTARAGLPGGIIGKAAPLLAAQGLIGGVAGAMAPSGYQTSTGQVDNAYQGPYTAQQRKPAFTGTTKDILASSGERQWFDVDVPEIRNVQGQLVQPGTSTAPGTPILQNYLLPTTKKTPKGSPMYGQRFVPYLTEQGTGYAHGGEVELSDGAFVLDARTVSEIGNGSSNAGMEALRRIGGRPVEGPGDGVSDSVPARIGGHQPARVARDEVVIPADVVRRMGKGDEKRGADKLYALMDKAHKARKRAGRGQDTKLRRGLA